jgi:hypothetical protein
VRRALAAAAALAIVAGALAAAWAFVLRDGSDPVSVEEAVESFDARSTAAKASPGPDPGVYVYATTGGETIDALIGSSHDYPPETTITARPGGCGVLLRWAPLDGRSTTWEICPAGEGWSLAGYRETHTFFGQTERTNYRCEADSAWLPPTGSTPSSRACTTGDTDEVSRVDVVSPSARLDVGGTEVEATHVRVELMLTGRTTGSGILEAWLLENGLPARLLIENDNRSKSPIGDVRYAEQADLELASLEPRR